MTTPIQLLRQSPSGPVLSEDDLTSDDVTNVSTVPGGTLTSALDHLLTRKIQYLDLDDDPVALWNFNDTINAVRGPNLTTTTGQWGFTDGYPGVRSLIVNVGARLQAASDPTLRLQGAMSCEAIFALNTLPMTWLCGVGGDDTVVNSVNNVSWGMGFPNNVTPRNMSVFWERATNSPISFASSLAGGSPGLPAIHTIIGVGFSRTAGGIVQPYINGRVLGPPSGVLQLPNGGSSGIFSIGAQLGTTANANFTLFSVAVYDRVRGTQEWLDSYNRSIGEGLGFLTSTDP